MDLESSNWGRSLGTDKSMHRRALLKSAAALALSTVAEPLTRAVDTAVPVVDAHIHLFDPARPGGVPWPEKTDTVLYQTGASCAL